ncbi:MAG: hypothetical protein GY724_04030 [Actinomycetia bacterium]|nr:hypothetical protein [Actinomycetes bacterium]
MMKPALGLWLGSVALALATLFNWTHNDWFPVTGDEPHYLVMADAIIHDHSFEQSAAYQREFDSHAIYPSGLAPPGSAVGSSTTHAVDGPNGLYNVHNVGLPVLVSIPFLVAGANGVKVFLVMATSLIVALAWRWSAFFTDSTKARSLAVVAVGCGAPFLAGGNQIYPDLLAGIIALYAGLRLMTLCETDELRYSPRASLVMALPVATAVAFLPWLQIKFAAAAVILSGGLAVGAYLKTRDPVQAAVYPIVTAVSGLMLGAYNLWAFGQFFGPYEDGALEYSSHSLMVLFGLHLDRFQGIFIQNPAYLMAVAFLVPFVRRYRLVGVVLLVTYASFVVPNALHPNWYGGASFAGRFAWSGAVTVVPLAVYGTIRLVERARIGTYLALGFIAVNASTYATFTFNRFDFYNRAYNIDAPGLWLSSYPSFHGAIAGFLPALYDPRFAYRYLVNAGYILFVAGVAAWGWRYRDGRSTEFLRTLWVLTGVAAVFVVAAAVTTDHTDKPAVWAASELPSQIGVIDGESRRAGESDGPGFLSHGPYLNLLRGSYSYAVSLIGEGNAGEQLGYVDIFASPSGTQLALIPIEPGAGEMRLDGTFTVPDDLSGSAVEVRTYFAGTGDLIVRSIELQPISN